MKYYSRKQKVYYGMIFMSLPPMPLLWKLCSRDCSCVKNKSAYNELVEDHYENFVSFVMLIHVLLQFQTQHIIVYLSPRLTDI